MANKNKITFSDRIKSILKAALKFILLLFVLSVVVVFLLRWINPVTSSIMIQRQISALIEGDFRFISYKWVSYDNVSPELPIAIVAAEDQNFPNHFGFDFDQIEKALEQHERGRKLRGASTITQQVAKNLFLWEGRSFIRKGIEAYFTILIELLWDKKRILEVHLNIAEMGDLIFGAGVASLIHFRKTPDKLTRSQAALLTATLPNPKRYSASRPSNYVLRRQAWIIRQVNALGGKNYLKDL
ncbi:MAG: monofunctional biosynthetic peptidoglycan transglycosylase [Ignavibacteriaceae bacterium]|nr:monofunctional biosynthetic peptidoglycan transglycosylase [Ignavibacteriaceae bacterium]